MSVYLDNAATSWPKPEEVYRAVEYALRHVGVAPGRGSYRQSLDAARIIFEARESLAKLLGVDNSSRIVFTHSATESLNLAIFGLLRTGDHVVTTAMEHNSLARPLHLLATKGVEVTWLKGDAAGLVTAEQVVKSIRNNTRLVALAHCSNVTGVIQPVGEIGEAISKTSALFLVDGAQSAGSLPLDAKKMSIDLLALPGHKGLFGPQGTGLLFMAEGIEPEPLLVGGTGGSSAGPGLPETAPERYESGTLNTPGIAGLKAGADFILATGLEVIREKEQALTRLLVDGLTDIPGVSIHGPAAGEERGAVVSFTVAGFDPAVIGFLLDRDHSIAVRVGLHCAPGAHQNLGTYPVGTIRVSPGYFNSEEDIHTFLSSLRSIVAQ